MAKAPGDADALPSIFPGAPLIDLMSRPVEQ
jgi:hypothetical protein